MSSHKLKSLQVELVKASEDIDNCLVSYERAGKALTAARKRRDKLAKQLEAFNASYKEPVVSEHALLRYIERIYGIDLAAVKQSILSPSTVKAIQVAGSGTYPIAAGGRAVVKDNVIVSIME